MRWSWQVGQISGIRIYVHGTFLILLAWVAVVHLAAGHGVWSTVSGLFLILALFATVVIHELSHALTARRFGVRTRDITLLPIGGVARVESIPTNPHHELLIALAGPAVNIVVALLCFLALMIFAIGTGFGTAFRVGGPFIAQLMWANVVITVFNLLPAFPMDGGRVFRALLALRMPYVRATRIAASVGQGMALLFGLIGLFFNPFLVFIALFVWLGAAEEARSVEARSLLGGVPVRRAMVRDYHSLSPHDSVAQAAVLAVGGFQQDFPVERGGELLGVLTRADLVNALAQKAHASPVSEFMRRDVFVADTSMMLGDVLLRMQATDSPVIPVVEGGTLVGLLTADSVGEFLLFQSAGLDERSEPLRAPPAPPAHPPGGRDRGVID